MTGYLTTKYFFVCECIATTCSLTTRGHRSVVGGVLVAYNSDMLNPGPRARIAFAAENGDIKFPNKHPVMSGTQEVFLFDKKHSAACGGNSLQQRWDTQSGLADAAGYLGGDTSKMQDIGVKELKRTHGILLRKLEGEPRAERSVHAMWKYYSKRLVRDLEGKGIVRAGTEIVSLG